MVFDSVFDGLLALIYQQLNPKMNLLQINVVKQVKFFVFERNSKRQSPLNTVRWW